MAAKRAASAAICVGSALLMGCGVGSPDAKPTSAEAGPNLLVVTIDTLRADHLGIYGYFRDTSPNIDRLAAQSLVFDHCVAPIPRTSPSHLSLFTGVYPHEHGVTSNFGRRRAADVAPGGSAAPRARLETLAESLQRRGLRTGGFVSATPLKRVTGAARGFDAWSEPAGHRRPAEETFGDALAWLESGSEPFFLWIHLFDLHGPFDDSLPVPPRYLVRYDTDAALEAWLGERRFAAEVTNRNYQAERTDRLNNVYDGVIRYSDDQLGLFLLALRERGLWNDTAIVLTSDHGEGLGQHAWAGHALVWGEQLRVPLLMRIPGVAPRRIASALSLLDVFPTLMGAAPGLAVPEFLAQARGIDVLRGEGERPPIFGMSTPALGEAMIMQAGWKYVRREKGGDALYDLTRDPHELEDRRGADPQRAARMRALLAANLRSQRAAGEKFGAQEVSEIDDREIRAQLEAIGYVEGKRDDEPASGEGHAREPAEP